MQTIQSIQTWQKLRKELKNKTIGFVPTMGNLHKGHLSLLERSLKENQITVLSVFINPTQFNDPNDFRKYPKTLERDLALAQELGVDYALTPNKEHMYPDGYRYRVTENDLSTIMEGKHRVGHFDGVLTIVLKLLNLVQPNRLYLGEKDRQQLLLIKNMINALFLDIEVVACPTIREENGLAMSSRNGLLSPKNRELASKFSQALMMDLPIETIKSKLNNYGFEIDYIQDYGQYRFGAVKIESVRLIDNVRIEHATMP